LQSAAFRFDGVEPNARSRRPHRAAGGAVVPALRGRLSRTPGMSLFIRDARIVNGNGTQPFRGSLRVRGEQIEEVSPSLTPAAGEQVIEAGGRVVLPGFVDAHTHALFAGNRLDEFELEQQGKSYLDILKAGGGIFATVRAVRKASEEALVESLLRRLFIMLREGTTTVEVKSGYGL